MKTFIEQYVEANDKERERLIVKSLSYARPNRRVRKGRFDWSISTPLGTYWVEFSDETNYLYFEDYGVSDFGMKNIQYPKWVYVYNKKGAAPIKEIDTLDFLESGIEYYKVLNL